jgi:polar amino acid transport system substrate-binding protein
MKARKVLGLAGIVVLVICVTLLTNAYVAKPESSAVAVKEAAFDRVMRTGILRCGYYVFPPMVVRDPNTNSFSGLSIDMLNAIGEKTGLKIEWTEEISFGTWPAALEAGRFDAVCDPLWPDMALGRQAIFTRPFFYGGLSPVVSATDTRFDGDYTKLNDPSVTIVAIDGNIQLFLAKEVFPKAHLLVVPANTDAATLAMNVIDHKADAVIWDRNAVLNFNAANASKLKMLDPGHPIKVEPFALPVDRKEFGLREFLDNAIADQLATGTIDRLLTKWETEPGMFLRTAEPYRTEPQ